MTSTPEPQLSSGLYDLVLSQWLEEAISRLPAGLGEAELQPLDTGDSHTALAEHLRHLLRRALDGLTGPERLQRQIDVCNQVIQILAAAAGGPLAREAVAAGARRLLSLRRTDIPGRPVSERPDTPLGLNCLLTGTRLDPSLVSQLREEIQTADRVDILCSFIKWSGIRIMEEAPGNVHPCPSRSQGYPSLYCVGLVRLLSCRAESGCPPCKS